jgi:hypothetical protein
MKHLLLAILLAAASQPTPAEELLCTGTLYANGLSAESTVVFRFSSTTLEASVGTTNGVATGTMTAKPDLYLGHLYTRSGPAYWFNLNRYTGLFYLGIAAADGSPDTKPEFMGACKRAERKF